MRLIVTSKKDLAGSNIYHHIARNFKFELDGEFEGSPIYRKKNVVLIATEKGQVEAEHLDEHFTPDYYVFASRHRSESQEKTLTVHTPGNLTTEAKVGGRPRELAYSAPNAVKAALQKLEKIRSLENLGYRVSMEVTHHGPTTLQRPVLFVEVGSTEEEWKDPKAVDAVAKAALKAAENEKTHDKGIGVGGNHYAPRHTRFILESKEALGHLIPTYALHSLDMAMFKEAVHKSGASFCFLDWKGLNRDQRKKVLTLAKKLGIQVRKHISTGEEAIPEDYIRYRVNKHIFELAEKINSTGLKQVILEKGGVPVEDRGHLKPEFWAARDLRADVLETCLKILKPRTPTISGRTLSLKVKKFDPERAKRLGLQPGPEYSKLQRGEEIKIKGRKISREDVMVTRKTEIELDSETLDLLEKCKRI